MSGPRSSEPHRGRLVDVLREAAAWVGYREGRDRDGTPNNRGEVGRIFGLDGQPWCAEFVAVVAELAGCQRDAVVPHTASCDHAMKWYRDRGRFGHRPKVGAQVFYGFPDDAQHTGLVERVGTVSLVTIEGNTNATGSREGDGVYRKYRNRHSSRILGYGYPPYPKAGRRRLRPPRTFVVRAGVGLAALAAAAGVTVPQLLAANPVLEHRAPRPGQTLTLPPAPPPHTTAPGGQSSPPAARPPHGRPPAGLHYGQRGPRVRALQLALRRLGYRIPDPLGRYGPYTRRAVRDYQRRHCTGIAGPATVAAILRKGKP